MHNRFFSLGMLSSFRSSKVLVISKRISQNQRVGRRRCRVCLLPTRKKKKKSLFLCLNFQGGWAPCREEDWPWSHVIIVAYGTGRLNESRSLLSSSLHRRAFTFFLLSVMSSVMSRCLSRKSFYFVWLLIGADPLHDGSPSVVVEQRPT